MEAQWRQIISGQSKRPAARLLQVALGAVGWPYGRAVAARNWLFDAEVLRAHQVERPVVSIGNLTLGGTGKTPFVEFICRWFLDRGKRPVILSRGYRSAGGQNDEALLLQANLPDVPHSQGKDRVALARRAIEEFRPDVLVLDDGFQHRRLARNLDIVLVDCTEPFGYGRLFPRGLLREPISSLRRADVVVLSRANLCTLTDRDRIRRQIVDAAGDKLIVSAEHRPTTLRSGLGESLPIGELKGKRVAAFCGIGNPAAFWQTLRELGAQVVATREFPDHFRYGPSDLRALDAWVAELNPDYVVTTQKDAVKLSAAPIGGRPLYSLQIAVALCEGTAALDAALRCLRTTKAVVRQVA